ncbi:MAG: hypothetical protein V4628_01810 [Pseudomonadota bacterium]
MESSLTATLARTSTHVSNFRSQLYSSPKKFIRNFLLLAGFAVSSLTAFAQPGFPDPSWTAPQLLNKSLTAIAMQPDGKLVATGTDAAESRFFIYRFDDTGNFDVSFGDAGVASTRPGTLSSLPADIAVANDGKIYAAGSFNNIAGEPVIAGFAVARHLGNGTPDPTFGIAGVARFSLDTLANFDDIDTPTRLRKIALQPDGKLLVMGDGHETGAASSVNSVVVARFDTDGQLDSTFGNNGLTLIRLAGNGFANDIRIAADGSILLAGNDTQFEGGFAFKLTTHGNPDQTFGAGGKVALPLTDTRDIKSIAIQDDNKILLGGRQGGSNLLVLRLNTDGSTDTGFGTDGYSIQDLSLWADYAMSLAIESSGKILVSGIKNARGGFQGNPFMMRLSPTGQRDVRFGTSGLVQLAGYSALDLAIDSADAAYVLTLNAPFSGSVDPNNSIHKLITLTPTDAPAVSIVGGDKTLADTDGVAGELISFSGTATDSDGTIVKTQWLVNGAVVATGATAPILLQDGTTIVTFKATDSDGAATTSSVTYTVQAPTTYLPRISGYSSQREPRQSEFSIAVRNSNNTLVSFAKTTDQLNVTGYIFPQDQDENFTADIYVVAVTSYGWFMRNLDGMFVPWNGMIATLVPAYEEQQLLAQLSVNMYSGKLALPGTYRLYVGYMRTDKSELIYTASTAAVEITP